jgi:multidrug efflux pump subunit AcrB
MWIVRLAVMAILIGLLGVVTILRMATDIFPSIDIPVVSVIWSYSGVAPEEMEKRFVTVCERAMTTTVNDIEHIESQSYSGVAVVKVYFHEGAKVEAGVAQITSICQTLLRIMPPGTTPPLIIQYSASNVLPIKQVNGAMVYIRDVANVRDGFAVQTNIVAQNRIRSALLTVLKSANASTLDIIKRVKEALPRIKATLPPELDITQLFDQSVFVRAAINGVLKEGVIAACLTALMILLFLGNWRSTLVVATSIPLSILCSIIILGALGQTLNIMTLGGLALAVGILVDDATVEIENIHRNLGEGKPMVRAILDGAQQIAVPAFVSTLCICIVFVPVFFLSGVARFLFQPLAMAVIFAMLASYFLSRTVVPTMVKFLLRAHAYDEAREKSSFFGCIHDRFNRGFEELRTRYTRMLGWSLDNRRTVFVVMLAAVILGATLMPFLGRDFFPQVDAGQFRLHVRAPPGTRLEATEQRFYEVGRLIRQVIPGTEIDTILDNIGLPTSGINLAFGDNANISSADGEILAALNPLNHRPTADYRTLRYRLREQFPDMEFHFQAADIVGQILNFGLPAPIDIQMTGRDPNNYALAKEIEARVEKIPGAADVHLHQLVHGPDLRVNVDRTRAEQLGLSRRDVAGTVLTSLSSSGQASPNFWLNFQNGVNYQVAVQTPQYKMDSLSSLLNTSIVTSGQMQPQLLGNLATLERSESPVIVNHYNVQPVFDILANVQGRDLGGVADDVQRVLTEFQSKLPRGTFLSMRGQVQSMNSSFLGPWRGYRLCHCPGLPLNGRKFSILDRSLHHYHSPARRAVRDRLDTFRHRHDA